MVKTDLFLALVIGIFITVIVVATIFFGNLWLNFTLAPLLIFLIMVYYWGRGHK